MGIGLESSSLCGEGVCRYSRLYCLSTKQLWNTMGTYFTYILYDLQMWLDTFLHYSAFPTISACTWTWLVAECL